jgi:hypothetical protein
LQFFPYKGLNDEDLAQGGMLWMEVSLPKWHLGENVTLLTDRQITVATRTAVEWAADHLHASVPAWQEWDLGRLDCVWSWDVGRTMPRYLDAFSRMPIHNYTRSPYTEGGQMQGHTWMTRNGGIKVNAYDKGRESGLSQADGILRLEVQHRASDAVRTLAKRHGMVDEHAFHQPKPKAGGLVTGKVARAEVDHWLHRIKAAGKWKSAGTLMEELVEEFGVQGAAGRWLFLSLYGRYGSAMVQQVGYAKRSYYRHSAEAKRRGWFQRAEGGADLPALKVPR